MVANPASSARNACTITTASSPSLCRTSPRSIRARNVRASRGSPGWLSPCMVHRSRNSSQRAFGSPAWCEIACSARASSRSRAASGHACVSSSSPMNSRSENRPRRPRAHSSRQARSCSANTLLERLQLPEVHLVVWVHWLASSRSLVHLPRIAASTSSAVCGSAASRSISLPSAPTRKSHSMRTPIFSSGM